MQNGTGVQVKPSRKMVVGYFESEAAKIGLPGEPKGGIVSHAYTPKQERG
jgi:hypothetical protein